MRNWLEYLCGLIGLCLVLSGVLYQIYSRPEKPRHLKVANEEPAKLYPACDYYPNGLNGKLCVESETFERTGELVFRPPPK